MKVMNKQLESIKNSCKELDQRHQDYMKDLNEFEIDHQKKEHGIFKEYHEARIKRLKYEIEAGAFTFDEGEEILNNLDLDNITEEELAAH